MSRREQLLRLRTIDAPRVTHMPVVDGGSAFYARIEWNGTAQAYEWHELEFDAGGPGWQDRTNGMSTAGIASATGSQDQPLAYHETLIPSLPSVTVLMRMVVDDTGAVQPVFAVPVQWDSGFAHRSSLAGSVTAGNRADYTLTAAELQTEDPTAGTPQPGVGVIGITTQPAGKAGWVKTEVVRNVFYLDSDSGGANTMYGYVKDVEYDVMGRPISESQLMIYTVLTPGPCQT